MKTTDRNNASIISTTAKYIPAAVLGALLLFGGTNKASAATVYSQTFTGGTGGLIDTTSTTGSGTWVGRDIISQNGNTTGNWGSSSLAFTPTSGFIYELTATINVTAANDSWLGVGFLQDNSNYGFFGTKTTPVALNRSGDWQVWAGPGANYTKTSNDVLIRLDTTGAQWTTSVYQGGTQIGSTYTYTSGNPTINYVGFISEGPAVGSVSAFQLTAVPEPSSFALVVGGIANLLLIRRRVQA